MSNGADSIAAAMKQRYPSLTNEEAAAVANAIVNLVAKSITAGHAIVGLSESDFRALQEVSQRDTSATIDFDKLFSSGFFAKLPASIRKKMG
ncbi:MAG TPA: hypothetical protein VD907_01210 [Verrucomicrobiae bacterium]|nr:hypothetical protein [Verrucomicrobiae bacterium]